MPNPYVRLQRLVAQFDVMAYSDNSSSLETIATKSVTRSILLICPSMSHPSIVEIKERYSDLLNNIIILPKTHSFDNDTNFPNLDIKGLALCGIKDSVVIDTVLRYIPNLKWIHTFSAGVDSTLTKGVKTLARSNSQLQITNARGAFSESLAEYVLFAAMYFAKKLPLCLDQYKKVIWHKYTPLVLRGKTMVIVGYGNIGEAVARLAKVGFGMRVLAVKRDPSKLTSVGRSYVDKVYHSVDVEQALAQSDYTVSILPGASSTKHFFDKKRFAAMRTGSVFISIGRGTVVDECALLESLKQDHLSGAALDVFEKEPLPKSSPLWKVGHEKLLFSPHAADWNPGHYSWSVDVFAANAQAFLKGNPFKFTVNVDLGY